MSGGNNLFTLAEGMEPGKWGWERICWEKLSGADKGRKEINAGNEANCWD